MAGVPGEELLIEMEAVAAGLAGQAGAMLRSRFRTTLEVEYKDEDKRDPVTSADKDGQDEMKDILGNFADLLHELLQGGVLQPNLTVALPHTMYWLGLLLFPPLAMYLVKRAERTEQRRISAPISYLLWVWGGFAGLHRFYLRSIPAGLVYVVLFVLVLLGNSIGTDARNVSSGFDNQLRVAEFMVARHQKAVDKGRYGAAEKLEAAIAERDAVMPGVDEARLELARWR